MSKPRRWAGIVARAASVAVTLMGCLVLLGWSLGIVALVELFPALTAMNPVTALLFILLGAGLLRLAWKKTVAPEGKDMVGRLLGGVVVLMGVLRLVDYAGVLPLHIDQLLFASRVNALEIYPQNEIAPNSAAGFVLCGLALSFSGFETRRRFRPAQVSVLIAAVIALFALVGYTYRVLYFYRFGASLPMSLDTAVAFALFCTGFLTARPDRGLMGVITSGTTGGAVARRLLPMAICIPWLLGAVLLYGEHAGYYRQEFALAIFAALSIVIFAGLIWWNARLLYVVDMERGRAERRMAAQHRATRCAEEQLRRATANLQRSNADLQQFAYVASHDLSEPLRMVTSYLQLLTERHGAALDDQGRGFVRFAVDGAQRMRTLIQGLLEYSRVEVRGASLEPIEAEDVFSAAISNLKVAIEESGAEVSHKTLPRVFGDGAQLTRVFQNLIGNGLKFHGTEQPRIEVGASQRDAHWVFFVRDNGIGINPKEFERIFVIFQRLHTRREYPGTGMGLAICKRIVERHGGHIWVESTPAKGSTFFFSLPATNEPALEASRHSPAP